MVLRRWIGVGALGIGGAFFSVGGVASRKLAISTSNITTAQDIQNRIGERNVVFSKTTCGYCDYAKRILLEHGVADLEVIELDKVEGGKQIQESLHQLTGQRTVPNVFIKGKWIGGCDDTIAAIHSGKI